jgi:hypothetical protein
VRSTQGEKISFLRECETTQGEKFFVGSLGGIEEGIYNKKSTEYTKNANFHPKEHQGHEEKRVVFSL